MVPFFMDYERPRFRAMRQLRDVVAFSLVQGVPLPSERVLAEQCQVSRNTLRWALARLTEEGALRSAGARTRIAMHPRMRSALVDQAIYLFSGVHSEALEHGPGWGDAVHLGVLMGLRERGRTVLLPGSGIPDDESVAAILLERPIGILLPEAVIKGFSDPRMVLAAERFSAAGIPTVVFGEAPASCDRVCSDHEAGAYELSRWLVARGRTRQLCLWIGNPVSNWLELRYAGHERALREAGHTLLAIEWIRPIEDCDFEQLVFTVAGHLAPYLLSAEPPDVILALTDGHVPCISAALRRCGREPGVAIEVAGYDDYWSSSPDRIHCPLPPTASVNKRNMEIGKVMVALLEERISDRLPAEAQTRMVTPALVVY